MPEIQALFQRVIHVIRFMILTMIHQCQRVEVNHVALFLKPVLFCFSFTPVDADEMLPRNDSKDKLRNSKSSFK